MMLVAFGISGSSTEMVSLLVTALTTSTASSRSEAAIKIGGIGSAGIHGMEGAFNDIKGDRFSSLRIKLCGFLGGADD